MIGPDSIQQLIRIVLYWLGGSLVSMGILTEADLMTVVGIVATAVAGVWWGYWNKERA